jgi:Tol biopolymer transport system component
MAPDGSLFAFSYLKGDDSLIAIKNMDEAVSSIVVRSSDRTLYERPIFSSDGQKLFFIARKKRDKSDLFFIDIDGSGITQITNGQKGAQNIQDLALSADGNTIYYINSGYFGHYSPIAASRPHQMDFYSIRTDGKELEQLSYSNSYALNGVSISPSGNEIYSRAKILHLSKPRHFSEFNPSPFITFTSTYPLSKFTGDGNVVLTSAKIEERRPGSFNSREELKLGDFSAVYGYALFLIDVNNETVKEIIHLDSYLDSPALSHDRKRILFVRNDSVWGGEAGRELWSVNLDGSGLQKIDLGLPKEIEGR